ncbi:hypothetical protein N0V92_001972 [Colletotrichum tropicale]|nr:hypothetical protein N0V92_001972 [Colletotrichum tropicale]
MSEKGGRWNNVEFVTSLMMSFYNELKGDGLSKEKKDAIEVRLRGQGFEDVTWNGIRRLLPTQLSRLVFFSLSHTPLASTPKYINIFNNEVTMADKSGKWNNPVLLESLVMAFHGLAKSADGLTKESKDAKWTPEIDQQILAAMVKVMIPTAEQYHAIMEELEPFGYGFTAITMK